jgi:hypothetical protein
MLANLLLLISCFTISTYMIYRTSDIYTKINVERQVATGNETIIFEQKKGCVDDNTNNTVRKALISTEAVK